MEEIGAYVPTTTWRWRFWGVVAIVVPLAGAIAAVVTRKPYAAAVIGLAAIATLISALLLASSTSRFVVSAVAHALYVEEHRLITKTRFLRVPLDRGRPKVTINGSSIFVERDHERVILTDVPDDLIDEIARRLKKVFAKSKAKPSQPTDAAPLGVEEATLEATRWLVLALFDSDIDGVSESLSAGADPDGHPDAGGRGAPLRLARALEMQDAAALLLEHGATTIDAGDGGEHDMLVAMAMAFGRSDVVARIETTSSGR